MVNASTGAPGNLEDRLGLISQMLEEAVSMLRTTMTEVREEADAAPHDEQQQRRKRGRGER